MEQASAIEKLLECSDLRETLEAYDSKRKKIKLLCKVLIAVGVMCFFAAAAVGHIMFFVGYAVIIAGLLTGACCYRKQQDFYRRNVIPHLVGMMEYDLKYSPDKGLAREKFEKFRLFGSFSRYHSEDLLTGTLGRTAIEISEVCIKRRKKSKNGSTYVTVFRGVVFVADFNKHFSGRTVLLPDVAERCFGKLVGNFLQKIQHGEEKLVRLENSEFEKTFAVYGSNEQEVRYILTPDMMEKLLALQRQERSPMRILFENGCIVLAIPRSGGWLEPPFWGGPETYLIASGLV